VVTNKPVWCALTGDDEHSSLPISTQYRGADIAHFGNVRGSNELEGHDAVIILGRDQHSVRDAEQRAMAIWYDTRDPIRCLPDVAGHANYPKRARRYLMRDGWWPLIPIPAFRLSWIKEARPRCCGRLTACG
jgi:hypothetical protein